MFVADPLLFYSPDLKSGMTPGTLPTLFISHGAPACRSNRECRFINSLPGLKKQFPGIAAVLCISVHGNTPRPAVNAVIKTATIHVDDQGVVSFIFSTPHELQVIRKIRSNPIGSVKAGFFLTKTFHFTIDPIFEGIFKIISEKTPIRPVKKDKTL